MKAQPSKVDPFLSYQIQLKLETPKKKKRKEKESWEL
jgi:hypothetical protein